MASLLLKNGSPFLVMCSFAFLEESKMHADHVADMSTKIKQSTVWSLTIPYKNVSWLYIFSITG